MKMSTAQTKERRIPAAWPLALLRWGWPIVVLLGILWFPFDWLSVAWPARFRRLARDYERLSATLVGLYLVVFARLMLQQWIHLH